MHVLPQSHGTGGAEEMTFGPAYDEDLDGERIRTQLDHIRAFMLSFREKDAWWTLGEIAHATRYPEASVSAQLRHLRKERFGSYVVQKRRRAGAGTWEYRVSMKEEVGV